MDDPFKKKVCIAILTFCWIFMLWWWFISSGGFFGLVVSVLVGGVAAAIGWFVTDLLA